MIPDAQFADPRLAAIYDPLDPDRSDLDAYVAMVHEFGADSILDIGCGTGTFACHLAQQGKDVVGLDPAAASLDVAWCKQYADRVTWIEGDMSALPPLQVDMATMTGNVAQVFLTDDEWMEVLRSIRKALRPGGRFVFEVRDPTRQGWREWTRDQTLRHVEIPDVGTVETWTDLVAVNKPTVSFRSTFVFEMSGAVVASNSTLRFRQRAEILTDLGAAGFVVEDLRGAPDRPGRELVFIAAHEAVTGHASSKT